jgi:hypothetical protein
MAPSLPRQLQEKLIAYEELLDSKAYTPADAHTADVLQMKAGQYSDMTKDMLAPLAPGALKVVWDLANGGSGASASVQAKCSMYILDRVIGKDVTTVNDPMAELIAELRGMPAPTADVTT